MITASLKNYRQSARKVRFVVDEIRGNKVVDAISKLSFIPNRAALPVKKLLESVAANARHNHNMEIDTLFIKSIVVEEGVTMKRWIPKARGTAHPIKKRTSQIKVVVDGVESKKKLKEEKKNKKEDTGNKLQKNRGDIPEAPLKEAFHARDRKTVGPVITTRTTNK